jgi:nitroimidazol reductase NimA-like FMN-containing flavoprotein (pyridoxamine 5'-phosphate oxidase superfamily)
LAPAVCHREGEDELVNSARTQQSTPLQPTPRTQLRRQRHRGASDRAELEDVLASGLFCHLGVIVDGSPVVLPTAYGVDLSDGPDGTLYLHGSVAARSLVAAREQTVCVTITVPDGLVLARSGFHHSVNYRSAVVFGQPRLVDDPAEKARGLDLVIDHLVPGRSAAVRPPTCKELAATALLALPLTEASVKRRAGDVDEDPEDHELPIWAGVIPLRLVAGEPIPAGNCALDTPAHVRDRAATL